MNAEQIRAFESANPGGTVTVAAAEALSGGILSAVIVLWAAWVLLSVYRSWGAGRTAGPEAGAAAGRTVFVTVVVLAIVTVWGQP